MHIYLFSLVMTASGIVIASLNTVVFFFGRGDSSLFGYQLNKINKFLERKMQRVVIHFF